MAPAIPTVYELAQRGATIPDYAAALDQAEDALVSSNRWIVTAAGAIKRNDDKFYGVAKCIDDAREANLIR